MLTMSSLFACFKPQTRDGGRRRDSMPAQNSEYNDGHLPPSGGQSYQSEVAYVELLRQSSLPLGLIIKGGVDKNFPVHVAAVRPGGVAGLSDALQVGDRILSINGTATEHLKNSEVEALLQNSGSVVNLEIAFEGPVVSQLDDMVLKTASISLPKDENKSFGFIISGGRLENRPLTISHVKQGSLAYKKGILKAGDRILQIGGHDMTNASQTEASHLLKSFPTRCSLLIEYDVTCHKELGNTNGQLIVLLQKPHGASLGISLFGSSSPGSPLWISRIRDAGIADRSGALHVGDQLLSINSYPMAGRTVQEASLLLSDSDINVRLEIIPYHNFPDRPAFTPTIDDGMSDASSRVSMITPLPGGSMRRPSQWPSIPSLGTTNVLCHPETMVISLTADSIGFGMSLQGGVTEYGSVPITVASIDPDGPAGILGQLQVGDRILTINEDHMEGASLQQAVKLVQEAGDYITMEVEFDVSDAVNPTAGVFDVKLVRTGCLNLGISIGGDKLGDLWIADLKKGGVAHRMGSLQPGDAILAIDGHSLESSAPIDAANLLKNTGNIITLAMRRDSLSSFITSQQAQVQPKADAVIFSVVLDREGSSLGIRLEGSDHPGKPIVISYIKPGGVADKTGTLRQGYRILAINGESLFEKTLDDAVRMLKASGDQVTLKISKGVRRSKGRAGRHGKYNKSLSKNQFSRSRLPYMNSFRSGRMSQMSESGLSSSDFHSSNQSIPHSSRYGGRNGRLSSLSTSGGVQESEDEALLTSLTTPGRLSPSGKHRHSPTGRGRNSPAKERGSPGRGSGVRTIGQSTNEVPTWGNRLSLTETTDEESAPLDERLPRHNRRYGTAGRNHSSLDHHHDNSSDQSDWTSTFPRMSSTNSSGGIWMKPSPDPHSQDTDRPPAGTVIAAGSREPAKGMEEAIIKELEGTIMNSKHFIATLNKLAEPGSSDQDSDSEPSKKQAITSQMKEQLRQVAKEILTPARLETIVVNLSKSVGSDLGFSVSDGLVEPGVYVKSLKPGSPADESGLLLPYDRIIKVNDIVVEDMDCCAVLPILKECGDDLILTVARNPLASGQLAAINGAASIDTPLSLTQSS